MYTQKKKICFWQEPFDGIRKKKKREEEEELLTQVRPFLIYEFKNYVSTFSVQAHGDKSNSYEEVLLKINILLSLTSDPHPIPLRQPLLTALEFTSGGSLHGSSSAW